jgi:hypothetical protein
LPGFGVAKKAIFFYKSPFDFFGSGQFKEMAKVLAHGQECGLRPAITSARSRGQRWKNWNRPLRRKKDKGRTPGPAFSYTLNT